HRDEQQEPAPLAIGRCRGGFYTCVHGGAGPADVLARLFGLGNPPPSARAEASSADGAAASSCSNASRCSIQDAVAVNSPRASATSCLTLAAAVLFMRRAAATCFVRCARCASICARVVAWAATPRAALT